MNNEYANMDIKEGGGQYLKISGGETADINILSPHPIKKVVHGLGKTTTNCLGDKCEHCQAGEKPRQRWIINVWDRKDKTVKLFEFGPMIAKQIKDNAEMLRDENKTVHEVDFRIKCTGSGMDTEYTVMRKELGEPIPDSTELIEIK